MMFLFLFYGISFLLSHEQSLLLFRDFLYFDLVVRILFNVAMF
jgi:hypothetical protein